MDNLLSLIPQEKLLYAVIGIFLPTIVGFLVYLKTEKDAIVEFVVDEVDDVLADLNEAKNNLVNAIDFIEDSIEGLVEALSPESPGGVVLTDSEKADAMYMANKALSELKKAKEAISSSIKFRD